MRLLVCGSRDWEGKEKREILEGVLEDLVSRMRVEPTVIQGKARGADHMARRWALKRGLFVEDFPADWDTHGRAAGFIRNKEMLDSGVNGVVAFSSQPKATKGTANMCRLAMGAGVPVCFVGPTGRLQLFN